MRPPVNKDEIMENQSIRINLPKVKKIIQEQSYERLQMAEQPTFSNKSPNAAMLFDDTSSATVSFGSRCDIPEDQKNEDEALQQPLYKKTFEKKPLFRKEKKQTEECEKNRKKQEEQGLKQPETLRRDSIVLSDEVSSSEGSEHYQRQPSQDDLDRITMRPPVSKDGIIEKQPIRINFQKPKKIIPEQSNGRLQMAERLKFSNKNPNVAMLFEDTSSATVSFGSSFKRKSNDNSRPRKIFSEDDATLTFAQKNAEDDNVLDLSNLQEMDEDEAQSINHNISQQDVKPCIEELEHNISQQDVKPSIKELNRTLILPQPNVEGLEKAIKISKPVVEFVHQTVQTVPVVIGLATQDDVDLLKLSPLEKSQHLVAQRKKVCELQKKLEDTNSRFKSLQVSICNLLKVIDPDFDCGQPDDIENVILDFIRVRVNAESD
ncbi:hypothetical protein ACJMK2_029521 [Sinanodonta woodiana]|uniref:Uncharacterized protein n=1 Tax=Sinanodonta woodiana TaxID=1069815 RepID=A0ABD3XE18_SINWO